MKQFSRSEVKDQGHMCTLHMCECYNGLSSRISVSCI